MPRQSQLGRSPLQAKGENHSPVDRPIVYARSSLIFTNNRPRAHPWTTPFGCSIFDAVSSHGKSGRPETVGWGFIPGNTPAIRERVLTPEVLFPPAYHAVWRDDERIPQGLKAESFGGLPDVGVKTPTYRSSRSGNRSSRSKNRVCTKAQSTSPRFSGLAAI